MKKFNINLLILIFAIVFFTLPIIGSVVLWWFKANGLSLVALVLIPLFVSYTGDKA